jgi:transcriptional regulator with XRE-family HTH domain
VPDDISVGRAVQAVRLSRNLRQSDVAARAGVSRQAVSRLERGLVDGMTVATLRAVGRALDMPPLVTLGWRGPETERLRDRLHAATVEAAAGQLEALGWELAPESSFNHFGERGSADILAWHSRQRALLVVEVKTRLWDLQDLLAGLDVKWRVLPAQARSRLGWNAAAVGVVLVLPELSTHRHVVERHAATFRAALPQRQLEVRAWLAEPRGNLRGIWF